MNRKEDVINGNRIGSKRMASLVFFLNTCDAVEANIINHVTSVSDHIEGQIIKMHA